MSSAIFIGAKKRNGSAIKEKCCWLHFPPISEKEAELGSSINPNFNATSGCAITTDKPPTHICSFWRWPLRPTNLLWYFLPWLGSFTATDVWGKVLRASSSRSLGKNNTIGEMGRIEEKKPSAMADYSEKYHMLANCIQPSL